MYTFFVTFALVFLVITFLKGFPKFFMSLTYELLQIRLHVICESLADKLMSWQ